MTVHFQRIPKGGAYPGLDRQAWLSGDLVGMVRARYYLAGQKYVAAFWPSAAGPEADLRPTAQQTGVAVQYMPILSAPQEQEWHVVAPEPITRYAFVVRWPDGREPELATRDGRLVVSEDKSELCPPYEAVVFSGNPTSTVGVTGPVQKFSHVVRFTPEEYTDALHEACAYMGIDSTGLSDEEMQARIDVRRSEIFAAIGRRFDEAFRKTPEQLPGHPLVQPRGVDGAAPAP